MGVDSWDDDEGFDAVDAGANDPVGTVSPAGCATGAPLSLK